jgi:plasmid stabilization system protein ParE
MKIKVTENAEDRLKEIYQYYKREASITIARRIKNDILERIKILKDYKELGPVDEHLKYLNLKHRKLTEGNYKVVYRVEEDTIYITDVFDTRQDPDKQKP